MSSSGGKIEQQISTEWESGVVTRERCGESGNSRLRRGSWAVDASRLSARAAPMYGQHTCWRIQFKEKFANYKVKTTRATAALCACSEGRVATHINACE